MNFQQLATNKCLHATYALSFYAIIQSSFLLSVVISVSSTNNELFVLMMLSECYLILETFITLFVIFKKKYYVYHLLVSILFIASKVTIIYTFLNLNQENKVLRNIEYFQLITSILQLIIVISQITMMQNLKQTYMSKLIKCDNILN